MKLSKRVKRLFRLGLFRLPSQHQIDILTDIGDMTEGLVEFLVVDDFKTLEDYIESIDAFMSLESKTFQYKIPLQYTIGKMIHCTNSIQIQHQILELRERIGFNK